MCSFIVMQQKKQRIVYKQIFTITNEPENCENQISKSKFLSKLKLCTFENFCMLFCAFQYLD